MSKLEPTRTYSNPTATEILRRLLDERRVEWSATTGAAGTIWTHWDAFNGYRVHAMDNGDGTVEIFGEWDVTPAQAIAATLGAGTCKRVMDSIDPFAMWVCDHCGHPLDTSENFCGGCGRKVVNA